MREMSVSEQRYQAVMAVLGDGRTVKEVARQWGVSRQTLHAWLAKYEAAGTTLVLVRDQGDYRGVRLMSS